MSNARGSRKLLFGTIARKSLWLLIKARTIDELETPAVLVDLDILEANIARLSDYARQHALHLRPHTKTHKIPAIAQMQVASGSHGITVAKSGEAEVMASAGLDNILLAYPIFGEQKLNRLANLASKKKITIALDSAITAEALAQAAQSAGSTINVLVELDVGMRRCGVATAEEATSLAKTVDKLSGLRFAGINLYPGHIWLLQQSRWPPCTWYQRRLKRCSTVFSAADLRAKW